MAENEPGNGEESGDQRMPLRIIRVYPPASKTWRRRPGKYDVRLQLSREVTPYERAALPKASKRLNIQGSILVIENTTLEEVKASTAELSEVVVTMERGGRSMQRAYEAHQADNEQRRESEAERLRRLADDIKFE